jgi:SPP1 gp7 family putative phage head morphogenesis protein
MKRDALDKHLRRVLREAQQSYRRAITAQVRGQEDGAEWAAFHEAAAALLLASWLAGAHGAVRKAKIPADAVESIVDAGTAMTFDRLEAPLSFEGFGTKWMKPITDWFRRRVPVSRDDWELLVEAAKRSSGDVTDHERQNALPDMRRRSPILDSLLRGVTRPTEGAISTVKRIVNDTFFVTAMNPEQTRQVQELIAQVIEEKPGKSVVGKRIRMMNLGDFVTTAQVLTGTALSSARLETVLRTNTNRALTEGQAEVLRDERVQAFVPLVEYSATRDKRTRETHLALDGYVGTMADFDRMGITPPCGFNCRCDLIPVPAAMAVDRGWVRPNGALDYAAIKRHNGSRQRVIDARQIPDPGFVNA